ncbi:hypothetical protein [Haladaptatus sp. DFWS20]|uniref:hypothetical protein n=1 Tax=Haladaptatus sp. DFWS20 TaxID=3403467 RepID=UPI003EBDDA37
MASDNPDFPIVSRLASQGVEIYIGYAFIFAATIGLILVSSFFDPSTVVQGLYGVIGAYLGGLVLYLYDRPIRSFSDSTIHVTTPSAKQYLKFNLIICCVSISVAGILETPLIAVLLLMLLGFPLLMIQIFGPMNQKLYLIQLCSLSGSIPMIKWLTSGLYFGYGDIFIHLRFVTELLSSNYVQFIPDLIYQSFGGFHSFIGSLRLISGLSGADSLYLSGVILYSVFPLITYLFAMSLSLNQLQAIAVATVIPSIYLFPFFASYFFPQSLAIPLVIIGLYLVIRQSTSSGIRFGLLGIMFIPALSFIHHFTYFLLIPILVLLFLLYWFVLRISPVQTESGFRLNYPLFVAALVVIVVHWVILAKGIYIGGLIFALLDIVTTLFESSGGGVQTFTLGQISAKSEFATGLHWLFSVSGIYFSALVAVSIIALGVIAKHRRKYHQLFPVLIVGLAGSVFIYKLPIPIKSSERIGFLWAIFFVFILGLGLYHATQQERHSIGSISLCLLLVVMGITAPLVGGHDYYKVKPGYDQQSTLSEQQSSMLASSGYFSQNYSSGVSTLWMPRKALQRFGVDRVDRSEVSERGITNSKTNTFLYLEWWPKYRLKAMAVNRSVYKNNIIMSEQWLQNAISSENKVYSSGKTGILWENETITVDEN